MSASRRRFRQEFKDELCQEVIATSKTIKDVAVAYRRIHADLAEEGTECSPELVRQIMRTQGLIACQPRPFRLTTEADAQGGGSGDA